jgi:putative ABC transport system ATP-binding protein
VSELPSGALLELDGVTRIYQSGNRRRVVLKGVSHRFEAGRMYAVVGPSGSGKTTLLSLASGLDSPTGGTVRFRGRDIADLGLGRYRNRHAATVFQSLNLLTYMTALQNITSAMEITGVKGGGRARRARELLDLLGVEAADQNRRTLQLSGSSSASPSRVRWPARWTSSSRTSPPGPWTWRRRAGSSRCSASSPTTTASA